MNETSEQRENAKRKKLLLLLLLLIDTTEDELGANAASLATGNIQPGTFGTNVYQHLVNAHSHAVMLGRTLAGNNQPFGHADGAFATTIVNEQKEFLDGFVSDIQSGKYTNDEGDLSEAAITARAKMYAKALLGTANEAWAFTVAADTIFFWRLEEGKDHCDDCPRIARESPYTIDSIPTFPGRGDTACLGNCFCYLETSTGQAGFNLADFKPSSTD